MIVSSTMELDIISKDMVKLTSHDWYNHSYTSNLPSHTTHNTSQSNITSYFARDEDIAVIEVAVSATILFLAITGNSCVIFSLANKRKRQSRMHLMILHLSLADLFVAFFNVLPQLIWDITYRFEGGPFLCVLVKYLQVVAMYASSYVLLATAVDRYYAICHPFASQSWTAKHAHGLVILAWTASLLFSLPQVFIFSYREVEQGSDVYDCWASFQPEWTLRAYITWMTASIFVLPTCLLGLLYGQITWVVWKAGRLEKKLLPANFTPMITRQENVHRSWDKESHFDAQNLSMEPVQVGSSNINTATRRHNDDAQAIDRDSGLKQRDQTNRYNSWRPHQISTGDAKCNKGCGNNTSSKNLLPDTLSDKLLRDQVCRIQKSSSLDIPQSDNQDMKLPGTYQFNMKNSRLKCQNEPPNPWARSCTELGLIKESHRVTTNLNEPNLDKQNQKHEKDIKLRCGFHQPIHSSARCESYCVLAGETPTAEKIPTTTNATAGEDGGHDTVREQVLGRIADKLEMCCSECVPNKNIQILQDCPDISCLSEEQLFSDLHEIYTEHDKHGLYRRDSGSRPGLEKEASASETKGLDFTTLEAFCFRTELSRTKTDNCIPFRHSTCDPTAESLKFVLKSEPFNMYSNSCGFLSVKSDFADKYTSQPCHSAHQLGVNADFFQQHCKLPQGCENVRIQQYIVSKDPDTLDNEHHSGTEDTVSTLGSLASLRLFDSHDMHKLDCFTSHSVMNSESSLTMTGEDAHENLLTAECVKQPQECRHSGMMLENLPAQELGHFGEKPGDTPRTMVIPGVCNGTAGGSVSDQRCTSAQQGLGISRAKLKTIKLTLTVVICYVLCWAPFFVGQMWAAYDINAPYDGPFFSIIMLLASVNSCTNPWIYTIFSNTICQRTRDIFSVPCRCFIACWKMAWPRKTPTTTSYLHPVQDCGNRRHIFEHASFSTFG